MPLLDRVAEEVGDPGARVGLQEPLADPPRVGHGGYLLREQPVPALRLDELGLRPAPLGDLQGEEHVRLLQLRGPLGDAALELGVGPAELLLGVLQLRDVELDPLPVEGRPVRIPDQGGDVPEPHGSAVGRDQPVLPAPGLPGPVVLVEGGERGLAVVGVEQLHPDVGLVEPLLAGVAEGPLDLGAHVDGPSVVVGGDEVHDGGEVLDERPVLLLRAAQLLLVQLLLGDVVQDPLPEQGLPPVVADRQRAVADPHDPAVGGDHAVLALEHVPLFARPSPLIGDAVDVVGVDLAVPLRRVPQVPLGRVPQELLDLGAHVEGVRPLLVRVDVDDGRDPLDQHPVQLVAPPLEPWVQGRGGPSLPHAGHILRVPADTRIAVTLRSGGWPSGRRRRC
ncbi:MAG: hypothetical protein KatS3mg014_0417 [Actinomycetota bacterium]|nr:MAG: hypothetical protein KatS3mg014_0417 [Actinomycetota bacterium]